MGVESKLSAEAAARFVLGLGHGWTAEDVKRAYRKLALVFHPDKNPGKSAEEATERFQAIAKAKDLLLGLSQGAASSGSSKRHQGYKQDTTTHQSRQGYKTSHAPPPPPPFPGPPRRFVPRERPAPREKPPAPKLMAMWMCGACQLRDLGSESSCGTGRSVPCGRATPASRCFCGHAFDEHVAVPGQDSDSEQRKLKCGHVGCLCGEFSYVPIGALCTCGHDSTAHDARPFHACLLPGCTCQTFHHAGMCACRHSWACHRTEIRTIAPSTNASRPVQRGSHPAWRSGDASTEEAEGSPTSGGSSEAPPPRSTRPASAKASCGPEADGSPASGGSSTPYEAPPPRSTRPSSAKASYWPYTTTPRATSSRSRRPSSARPATPGPNLNVRGRPMNPAPQPPPGREGDSPTEPSTAGQTSGTQSAATSPSKAKQSTTHQTSGTQPAATPTSKTGTSKTEAPTSFSTTEASAATAKSRARPSSAPPSRSATAAGPTAFSSEASYQYNNSSARRSSTPQGLRPNSLGRSRPRPPFLRASTSGATPQSAPSSVRKPPLPTGSTGPRAGKAAWDASSTPLAADQSTFAAPYPSTRIHATSTEGGSPEASAEKTSDNQNLKRNVFEDREVDRSSSIEPDEEPDTEPGESTNLPSPTGGCPPHAATPNETPNSGSRHHYKDSTAAMFSVLERGVFSEAPEQQKEEEKGSRHRLWASMSSSSFARPTGSASEVAAAAAAAAATAVSSDGRPWWERLHDRTKMRHSMGGPNRKPSVPPAKPRTPLDTSHMSASEVLHAAAASARYPAAPRSRARPPSAPPAFRGSRASSAGRDRRTSAQDARQERPASGRPAPTPSREHSQEDPSLFQESYIYEDEETTFIPETDGPVFFGVDSDDEGDLCQDQGTSSKGAAEPALDPQMAWQQATLDRLSELRKTLGQM